MTGTHDACELAKDSMTEASDEAALSLSGYDGLRIDIYRLLARLLREAPDADLLGFLAELEVAEDNGNLQACWRALSLAASTAQPENLERAHFRHLIGVIQGELLPYASWYLTGSLMEMPLVELRRDLKRLGYERAPDVKEPEDHIAAMLEVMAMLIESDPDQQALFFQRHLAPWGSDFMVDLSRVDTPFYASVGQLGHLFLQQEGALNIPDGTSPPIDASAPDISRQDPSRT
ncbi:molecular chaperone [Halomonas sp. M20]|uniref:TorD/DmsD family molecular chaperone n=1 Tax=Halomonas sp. M20 TaxID=2763264 RepID=UPI001D0BAAFB|nr:molecular chaperone TorD family protein [Halomonas sp. M20]